MPREQGPALLHIHSQEARHEDAWIVGNRRGLEALRETLTSALDIVHAAGDFSVSDGAGFTVRIFFVDDPPEAPAWRQAALPYASERSAGGTWPWEVAPTQKIEVVKAEEADERRNDG